MTKINNKKSDYDLLSESIREAGELAASFFKKGASFWSKSRGDPVTEADIAVDALLKNRLIGPRPHYGWLSEESEDDHNRLKCARVWVVDPIDGTRAFIEGRSEFTISVGLIENGSPTLGMVLNPIHKQLFEAVRDKGARCNDKLIRTSIIEDLNDARLLAGYRALSQHQGFRNLREDQCSAVNSIAYRMSLVACGQYDATIALTEKNDWDIAAADIIVREAGGSVSAPDGSIFRYNKECVTHPGVIAAGSNIYDRIVKYLCD